VGAIPSAAGVDFAFAPSDLSPSTAHHARLRRASADTTIETHSDMLIRSENCETTIPAPPWRPKLLVQLSSRAELGEIILQRNTRLCYKRARAILSRDTRARPFKQRKNREEGKKQKGMKCRARETETVESLQPPPRRRRSSTATIRFQLITKLLPVRRQLLHYVSFFPSPREASGE